MQRMVYTLFRFKCLIPFFNLNLFCLFFCELMKKEKKNKEKMLNEIWLKNKIKKKQKEKMVKEKKEKGKKYEFTRKKKKRKIRVTRKKTIRNIIQKKKKER